MPVQVKTIEEVITTLEIIISECEVNGNPAGYFAALYQKVTIRVKEGIGSGLFEDGARMEQLDVIFAKRYLDAYFDFIRMKPVTQSWQKTFELQDKYQPVVLQHLLMGMNAHINLDLGVAAAEIAKGKYSADLQNDFNRINKILSSLVHEVEDSLSLIWPVLKFILKHTGKVDDYLVDFSMKLARDGAWKFALSLSGLSGKQLELTIFERDRKVTAKTDVVLKPGFIASIVLWVVRITERGSVAEKIRKIKKGGRFHEPPHNNP